jgi:flavin reductase (DIM6/NTAB) family NADH-FMN oxidoreductase RutF
MPVQPIPKSKSVNTMPYSGQGSAWPARKSRSCLIRQGERRRWGDDGSVRHARLRARERAWAQAQSIQRNYRAAADRLDFIENPEGGIQPRAVQLFNAFNYDPPILGFASISWKDSVQNVSETGEFVWNLVSKDLGDRMNATSSPHARGVDEFEVAGLTKVPSRFVSVPRVAESRAAMECKVIDVVQFKTHTGEPVQGWLILGEVVAVYIDKALIKDGVYQTALPNPILRAGRGGDYVEVTQDRMFEMDRPQGSSHPAFHGS